MENRRRGVKRKRQHVSGGVGVIARDWQEEGRRRERFRLVTHEVGDGIGGALRGAHRRRRDFIDLNDLRLRARAKREVPQVLGSAREDVRQVRESDRILALLESEPDACRP